MNIIQIIPAPADTFAVRFGYRKLTKDGQLGHYWFEDYRRVHGFALVEEEPNQRAVVPMIFGDSESGEWTAPDLNVEPDDGWWGIVESCVESEISCPLLDEPLQTHTHRGKWEPIEKLA